MNKIAYITAGIPLSKGETFILTEMLMLRGLGIDLLIIPRDCKGAVFHKGAETLLDITMNIPWMSFSIVRSLIGYFAAHPVSFSRLMHNIFFRARSVRTALKNIIILPKSLHIAAILKRSSISHIHAHWASTTATMAYIISEVSQISWSFTAHRWDISENNILKEKCKKASFVRAISNAGKEEILQLIGDIALADKISVIHMGVPVPESLATEQVTGIFKVLCPANFVEVKGHKYLIDACSILKNRGIKIKCLFAGDGPIENDLKKYVRRLHLDDMVQFSGRLPHETIEDLYKRRAIRAVVLPSILTLGGEKEGIPVALMEAMSYRIPVVATNTGSISELIGDGAGVMIEEKDPLAIADALEKLSQSAAFYAMVANKGEAKIRADFNARTISEKLMESFTAAERRFNHVRRHVA